jgi:hypothetical protein
MVVEAILKKAGNVAFSCAIPILVGFRPFESRVGCVEIIIQHPLGRSA